MRSRHVLSRLLGALLLWLALIAPAAAAIGTPTQIGTAAASSGTTLALTTSVTVNANDLVIYVAGGALERSVTSIVDSASHTYTVLTIGTAGNPSTIIAYCYNCPLASGGTITGTWSASGTNHSATAFKISGMASLPADAVSTAQQGSGASATSTSTGTLAQASELVVGCVTVSTTISAFVPGGSFTDIGGILATQAIKTSYQVVSSTSTVSWAPSWTTSGSYESIVVSFKADVGGGASGALLGVGQ